MQKKYNLIIIAILGVVVLGVVSFFAYKNYSINKILKLGIEQINDKEYGKAILSYEVVLKDKPNNEEALEYKKMIEKYLEAKKLFDGGNISESNQEVEEISKNYLNFTGLKEDTDNLKNQIAESIKKDTEINNNINKVRELVNSKGYDEAKNLITELEKEKLSESQNQQKEDLKSVISSEMARIEAEKKSEEEVRKAQEQKQSSNGTITTEKAEEMVRNYLKNKGQYVPPIVAVDSEDNTQYIVRCYEQFVDHTATSGWYYVNKSTGNITSMF